MANRRPIVRNGGKNEVLQSGDTLDVDIIEGAVADDDPRLSDAREWTAATVDQAEAEAGTATTRRAWTSERVRQAIVAWWTTVGTTVGKALLSLANPSAISFIRINADNSVTARSATDMRTDLGLGTMAVENTTNYVANDSFYASATAGMNVTPMKMIGDFGADPSTNYYVILSKYDDIARIQGLLYAVKGSSNFNPSCTYLINSSVAQTAGAALGRRTFSCIALSGGGNTPGTLVTLTHGGVNYIALEFTVTGSPSYRAFYFQGLVRTTTDMFIALAAAVSAVTPYNGGNANTVGLLGTTLPNTAISGLGTAATANLTASGNRWDRVPYVASDGQTEIGQFLDFHAASGSTDNYDFRIGVSGATDGDFNFYRDDETQVAGMTNSGRLRLLAGSNAAPTFSRLDDTDTGVTLNGSDTLGLIAGGVERLGIGTVNIFMRSPHNTKATDLLTAVSAASQVLKPLLSDSTMQISYGATANDTSYLQVSNSAGTTPWNLNLNPYGGTVSAGGNALWHAGNLVKTSSQLSVTTGEMLKVGDYGLGLMLPQLTTDLNNHTTPGMAFLTGSAVTNYPSGFGSSAAIIEVRAGSTNTTAGPHSANGRIIQRATKYLASGDAKISAVRGFDGTSWTAWYYDYGLALTAGDARTNLGLGTAATATVTTTQQSTTAGELLKVGDFGLGLMMPLVSTDLNAQMVSGTKFIATSAAPNFPTEFGTSSVVLEVFAGSTNTTAGPHSTNQRLIQRATVYSSSGSTLREAMRSYNGTTWSSWHYDYALALTAADARTNLGLGTAALGTITTTNQSTTANQLVKVGDYGLGIGRAVSATPDFNTFTTPGVYLLSGTGATNGPAAAAFMLEVQAGSASATNDRIIQIATRIGSSAPWDTWSRAYNGATWSSWFQFLATAGDVSIGSGATGARIGVTSTVDAPGIDIQNSVASHATDALRVNNTASTGGNLLRLRSAGADRLVVTGAGQMQGANGSAATPFYSFLNDPNTGIYGDGADNLNFSTNGTSQLAISTSSITGNLSFRCGSAGGLTNPEYGFASESGVGGLYRGALDTIGLCVGSGGSSSSVLHIGPTASFAVPVNCPVSALEAVPVISLRFGDSNTGLWGTASDVIGIMTNNTKRLTINTTSIAATLPITINSQPVSYQVAVPSTPTSAGVAGTWAADATHFYSCYATNTWRRVAHSTW